MGAGDPKASQRQPWLQGNQGASRQVCSHSARLVGEQSPRLGLRDPAWIMGETLFSLKLKLNIIGNKMLGVRSSAGAREALLIN